jgi:hypothetical protein
MSTCLFYFLIFFFLTICKNKSLITSALINNSFHRRAQRGATLVHMAYTGSFPYMLKEEQKITNSKKLEK